LEGGSASASAPGPSRLRPATSSRYRPLQSPRPDRRSPPVRWPPMLPMDRMDRMDRAKNARAFRAPHGRRRSVQTDRGQSPRSSPSSAVISGDHYPHHPMASGLATCVAQRRVAPPSDNRTGLAPERLPNDLPCFAWIPWIARATHGRLVQSMDADDEFGEFGLLTDDIVQALKLRRLGADRVSPSDWPSMLCMSCMNNMPVTHCKAWAPAMSAVRSAVGAGSRRRGAGRDGPLGLVRT
jgi:hypothetical protein